MADLSDPVVFARKLEKAKEAVDGCDERFWWGGREKQRGEGSLKRLEEMNKAGQLRCLDPLEKLCHEIPEGTTEGQVRLFLDCVKKGGDLKSAARMARLGPGVVEKWIAKGQVEALGWFRAFFMEYELALGELGMKLNERIMEAGLEAKHWKANLYMGQQRLPEAFGKEGGNDNGGGGRGDINVGVVVNNSGKLPMEQEKALQKVSILDLKAALAVEPEEEEEGDGGNLDEGIEGENFSIDEACYQAADELELEVNWEDL
jgi:hypothetical protein